MSTPLGEGLRPLPILTGGRNEPFWTVREPSEDETRKQPDDEALMAQLQARSLGALDALFDRYARLVYTIAFRTLRDSGEAEDVVQDTFFYLFKKAPLFDSLKGTARGWIVQVAFHQALDRKSHLRRRGFYLGTEIDSTNDTLVGRTDLDREIGAKLNRVHLERALAELPEAQRRTLELYYFEGLDLREIADERNEPLGNVRHHYYRGLESLRRSAFARKLRKD
jgi:RNA polymerase sigma-70 factor (ECF subfamily)